MRKCFVTFLVLASTFAVSQDDNGAMAVVGKVSSLGPGADLAVAISPKTSVRLGANVFRYGRSFDRDGVTYHGNLNLLSINALWDFFPTAGRLHVSGGALLYNGNKLDANSNVPGGQSFSLGNQTYTSSLADPVHGSGNVTTRKIAPMVLVGFGNPAHGESRLAMSFDAGVAFQGTPNVRLNFAGTACDASGTICRNAATDPDVQASVLQEQQKLNNDIGMFRFYPIVQFSIGYRF